MAHPIERFIDAVEYDLTSTCWLWSRSTTPKGYGEFHADGKVRRAHRWAYEHYIGAIPEGMVVDHLCCNTLCVNPEHLEVVTQRENIIRGNAPAAKQFRQTECIHGHPFDEQNTYINPEGRRQCKSCRRAIDRRRYGASKNRVYTC